MAPRPRRPACAQESGPAGPLRLSPWDPVESVSQRGLLGRSPKLTQTTEAHGKSSRAVPAGNDNSRPDEATQNGESIGEPVSQRASAAWAQGPRLLRRGHPAHPGLQPLGVAALHVPPWAARARPSLSHEAQASACTPHAKGAAWTHPRRARTRGEGEWDCPRRPEVVPLRPASEGFSKTTSRLLIRRPSPPHRHSEPSPPRGGAPDARACGPRRREGRDAGRGIYLCPGAFPGTPPPPRSRRRCSATFFSAAAESPTSEGLQTERFWSLAEEKLAGFQCSWRTLGGLHCSVCRREQRCVCLHRSLAPPPRRPPPPAHRHYRRGRALPGVRAPVRPERERHVTRDQMRLFWTVYSALG